MAYNPGVSDISGQLRAQGMTRGMNSLLEGFDVGIKTYQQNKQIADTSIADFGAAVANSDALKALLTDEEQRSKLPSDVVKAYLKLNKEGSLGVREASLLGGFARSYTKNEEDRQQRDVRAQQIATSKQAGMLAAAQNARETAAADQAQGLYNRNLNAVENMRRTMSTADNLEAGYPIDFPARPVPGPASFGSYRDALGTAPLPVQAPTTSESPFMRSATPALQVPNSPLRSGITTPTPNVNILEDYQNKMGNVPVDGNMGGAGVLTVRAADRIRGKAEALKDTSLGQLIAMGIDPTKEQMVNLTGRDLVSDAAAARATAAAASKEAQNVYESRKIEIARERLKLDDDRSKDKVHPDIRTFDELLKRGTLNPKTYDSAITRWVENRVDSRSEREKLLGGLRDLFPDTPDTPAAPKPAAPKPAAPKSRVLAPKGFVYMVDAKGNVGLIREENVEKAMTRGGTIL